RTQPAADVCCSELALGLIQISVALVQPPISVKEAESKRDHRIEARADLAGIPRGIQIHKKDSQKAGRKCSIALQSQAQLFSLQPEFKQDQPADEPGIRHADRAQLVPGN